MKLFRKLVPKAAQHRKALLSRAGFPSAILLWFVVVGVGLSILWSYEQAPGLAVAAPSRWPDHSRIKPAPDRATLVMLAHPRCPCTRASIEELDKLMAHCADRVRAYVVLMKPHGAADDWVETDLWRQAVRIPGVSVLIDEDGIEAQHFCAAVSGQVLLYDANRKLLFSGGITASRGHVGDNAGAAAIEALINAGSADNDHSLVFGCPLFDPDSYCSNRTYEKTGN